MIQWPTHIRNTSYHKTSMLPTENFAIICQLFLLKYQWFTRLLMLVSMRPGPLYHQRAIIALPLSFSMQQLVLLIPKELKTHVQLLTVLPRINNYWWTLPINSQLKHILQAVCIIYGILKMNSRGKLRNPEQRENLWHTNIVFTNILHLHSFQENLM